MTGVPEERPREGTALASRGNAAQREPLSRLQALSFLASEAGALSAAADAALLVARTEEGLFYVTCVGQFKRGKSTLINAIVGEELLPAGVVPVTSVVTVVRHGPERAARIRFSSGEWRSISAANLASFVSEEENPGNRKGVLAAEIRLPHSLLRSGLCLVDTPGLGSISEANTAATRAFVPHIDAAIVVLGADPPISGEELTLVAEISRTVSHLLFVLNKSDRLPDRDRGEAMRFAERVLTERLGRPVGPILEVSAAEAIREGEPTRDLPALHDALSELARAAGADLVAAARERGVRRIAERVLAFIEEQRQALMRPIETSQARIDSIRRSVDGASLALGDLAYLFAAEQQRLSDEFFQRRSDFLARTVPAASKELEAVLATPSASGPALRRFASAAARRVAQRTIEQWLAEIEPIAEQRYRAAMSRFIELSNDFLERLPADDEAFSSSEPARLDPEAGFRTRRRFFFNDLFELAPAEVRLLDLARHGERAAAAARSDAVRYLGTLLDHNSTRVVNDLEERTLESRRGLEAEIQRRLRERLESATAALDRARVHLLGGSAAVEEELLRIESLTRRVQALAESSPPPPDTASAF